MFSISLADFTLTCHTGPMPKYAIDHSERATLVEEFDENSSEDDLCMLTVARGFGWPFLIVKQTCERPGIFGPCALLVPESELLFLGVGERLLAYNLNPPARLWEDSTDCGIWRWDRRGDYVILSGELELATWDIRGKKRWSMYVEPPWGYSVVGDRIRLDVMGTISNFPMETGPSTIQ